MGAKATSSLIPPLPPHIALSKINVTLVPERVEGSTSAHYKHSILCTAIVTCEGKTGGGDGGSNSSIHRVAHRLGHA